MITFLIDGKVVTEADCCTLFAHRTLVDREKKCLAYIDKDMHSILDLGCYSGHFAKALTEQFKDKLIISGDYDEENLKIARHVHPTIANLFRKLNAYQLDLENLSLDCVIFQEVIEHLEGAAVAIKEINRVLKMDGSLIISTPSPYYWRDFRAFLKHEALRTFLKRDLPLSDAIFYNEHEWNRHIYCWTPTTLYTLLKVNGFEYVSHTYGQDARYSLEKWFLKCFPFFSPTMVLKVKKISEANKGIV